jgi:hypothetical protein
MQLIVVLIHQGKRSEAKALIDSIERRNYLGSLDRFVQPLQEAFDHTVATETPDGT